jgi:hypothetical protein
MRELEKEEERENERKAEVKRVKVSNVRVIKAPVPKKKGNSFQDHYSEQRLIQMATTPHGAKKKKKKAKKND